MRCFFLLSLFIALSNNLVADTATSNLREWLLRLDQASLPGDCGLLRVLTNETSAEVISFKIESSYPQLNWYLDISDISKAEVLQLADGGMQFQYRESWVKSMPPGPGKNAGFRSRYTLQLRANESNIGEFKLIVEDFDPRTKSWGPFFDIRRRLNPTIDCR